MMGHSHWRGAWREGKEWMHFCIDSRDGPCLANVLLQTRAGRVEGVVTLLCFDAGRPRGEQVRTNDVRVEPGSTRVVVGRSSVEATSGGYRLDLRLPRMALRAELTALSPPTIPSSTDYGDAMLHWSVTPSSRVRGSLVIERAETALGSFAYADHNWGRFAWGEAMAWEWAQARFGSVCVVWMRMLRRSTRRELGRALLLFEDGRSAGAWVGPQVHRRESGWLSTRARCTVPGALGMRVADRVTGVPGALELHGDRPDVSLRLSAREVARVVVPDDDGRGVTVIGEVVCDAALIRRDGELRGTGVLEVVHGA